MILQLSLFQIFFMALSIVGLSFSILYLFIGQSPQESEYEIPRETFRSHSAAPAQQKPVAPSAYSPPQRTSKGRTRKKSRPSADVIEVNFRDVGSNVDVAMDIIHLSREEKTRGDFTASTISNIFDLASSD